MRITNFGIIRYSRVLKPQEGKGEHLCPACGEITRISSEEGVSNVVMDGDTLQKVEYFCHLGDMIVRY